MSGFYRPYAAPAEPWVMRQTWEKLLFMHWPLPAQALRPLIPADLDIDTFDGQAWIAVVPFQMREVYPFGAMAVPWLSAFAELNVRTYVVKDGKPGVWFFSLDAANVLAVQIARRWFRLPYFHADMTCRPAPAHAPETEQWVHYYSRRIHPGSAVATLEGRYRPIGPTFAPRPGSLEYFLTARYCLYASEGGLTGQVEAGQAIWRGEIDHVPWPLQVAQADIICNTMMRWLGIELAVTPALLHYVDRLDVVVWPLEMTTASRSTQD